jgi:hypothetical protein
MCHAFKVGDARVVSPYLAATPGTNIKNVVKDSLYHPTVADSHDDLIPIPLHDLLDERANPRAKVHHRLTPL